jgi:hypothetical protein
MALGATKPVGSPKALHVGAARRRRNRGGSSADGTSDPASSRAIAELLRTWNNGVRHRPPAERIAWLTRAGIIALGAKRTHELLRAIEADRQSLIDLDPSGAWTEGWESTGAKIPAEESAIAALKRQRGRGRRDYHAVADVNCRGMPLSSGATRFGAHDLARQRLLPPQCDDEARIDAMDVLRAASDEVLLQWPPCAMAVKKDAIRLYGGVEQPKRLRLRGADPYGCFRRSNGGDRT